MRTEPLMEASTGFEYGEIGYSPNGEPWDVPLGIPELENIWEYLNDPDVPYGTAWGLILLRDATPDTKDNQQMLIYVVESEVFGETFGEESKQILHEHLVRSISSHAKKAGYPAFLVEDGPSGAQSVYLTTDVEDYNKSTARWDLAQANGR